MEGGRSGQRDAIFSIEFTADLLAAHVHHISRRREQAPGTSSLVAPQQRAIRTHHRILSVRAPDSAQRVQTTLPARRQLSQRHHRGWLLFLQEQIKDIIIIVRRRGQQGLPQKTVSKRRARETPQQPRVTRRAVRLKSPQPRVRSRA
jgi:hypothetical protein